MKVVVGVAGAAAVLLGIWWTVGRGASPDASPSDPSSSGTFPTTTIELPDDAELPADPRDEIPILPTHGTAMMKIDHSLERPAFSYDLAADFTITIDDLVHGYVETEATMVEIIPMYVGSHTLTSITPVTYEVFGLFHPSICVFDLTVTETVLVSQMSAVDTVWGVSPAQPDVGDVVATFEVEFEEQSLDFFIISGSGAMSFTLYDIVLPESAGCGFSE